MNRRLINIIGIIIAIIFLASNLSHSKDFELEKFKKSLPKMLGANNIGKEFYLTFHPCWETYNPNNAVRIYVSSGVRTLVTLEVPGMGYIATKMTIPNDIIEFPLYPGLAQCYTKTDRQKPMIEQVFPGRAIYIHAEAPIIVYGVTRYQYTSDGYLAIPVSSWGKEYIVASYADPVTENFGVGQYLPSYTSVVSAYDNTKVRFTMGGNVWSKTAGDLKPGESVTVNMNAGDVYLVAGSGPRADLSGSKIVASKPVGVISGNFCAYIPSEYGYCDFIIEMDLPTNTWGTKYHVSQIATRRKNSLLKVFAKEPMTKLFRNGRQIGLIQTAGGVSGYGYLEIRIDEELNQPWVWSGDKPISVTQYNPGQTYDGVVSDPFQLVLSPIEQYQTEITFNTPGIRGGYGYPDNYVNIVYLGELNGEIPDDLEYATVSEGQFTWKKVSTISPTAGFPFKDSEQKGRQYYSKTIWLPGDGVYKIRANDPFVAYAYGFSDYDSYGFPTSVALGDLEKPDTIPPVPIWTMDCGNIKGATVTDKPDDPFVRSNLALIIFHREESFNYKFSYKPFEAGTDYRTTWEAIIEDPLLDARAVITFADRRGNDTTIVIEYFATKLAIEPDFYDFGLLQVGEVKNHPFKLINKSKGKIKITELKLQNGKQYFTLHDYTLPRELNAEEYMTFTVRFTATKDGEFLDSIGASDLCISKYMSHIQARVGQPTIEVSDASWGDMTVGTTDTRTIEIRNYGSTDLIITGYSGPFHPANVYVPKGLKKMTVQDPLIIKPGDRYTFNVDFTPKDQIEYLDKIIFHSNANKTDSIADLSGRGILADLVANSADWEKRRIHRTNFPAGPYDPPNKTIVLRNSGTADVTIPDIAIEDTYGNGSAFIFDRNRFRNLTIKAKDSAYIPVIFQPTTVGKHRIKITYPGNTAGSDTYTLLEGWGILGKISTFDMDFDTTIIQDMLGIQKRKIRITNNNWTDAQGTDVSDDVTITNLVIQPQYSISTDPNNWGDEGFRFDINNIYYSGTMSRVKLPVTLKKDNAEYIEIDAEFVAQHIGSHQASVSTKSDAENDVTSNWSGYGVAQGVYVTGGSSLICIHETEIIRCEVGNTGSGIVTVTAVRMSPKLAEFEFIDPSVQNGFQLGPNEKKIIEILFKPTVVGTPATRLIVENTTLDYPTVEAQIRGQSIYYSRFTNNKTTADRNRVISGQSFYYMINLEGGDDLTLAKVTEFSSKIRYKKDFIVALRDEIHIGSAIRNDFDMQVQYDIIDQQNKIEEITLIFTAKPGRFLNHSGEIAKIGFRSFLPWYTTELTTDVKDTAVTILYDISVIGTKCLDIDNDQTTITLEPTCVTNLRPIKMSGSQYALYQISPNPVGASGTNIEFSVALQGWTDVRIINSAGETVFVLVAGELAPGQYSIPLPIEQLSSGAYFCTMHSGPFQDQQKIIINK